MAHHGKQPPISEELKKAMGLDKDETTSKLKQIMREYREENENNVWPDGMMREDDEGAIPLAVGVENGRVVLRFPKPVAWVGFSPDQAIDIAQSLIKKARIANPKQVVTVKLGDE